MSESGTRRRSTRARRSTRNTKPEVVDLTHTDDDEPEQPEVAVVTVKKEPVDDVTPVEDPKQVEEKKEEKKQEARQEDVKQIKVEDLPVVAPERTLKPTRVVKLRKLPNQGNTMMLGGCERDLGAVGVTPRDTCLTMYMTAQYSDLVQSIKQSGGQMRPGRSRKPGEPWDLYDGLPLQVDHSRYVTKIRDQTTTNQCGGLSSAAGYEILFNRSMADQGLDIGAEPFEVSPMYTYYHAI